MVQRLWEYRKSTDLNDCSMVHSYTEGIFQVMCTNDSGDLILHIIDELAEKPELDAYLKGNTPANISSMQIEQPFTMLPKGFKNTNMPELDDEIQSQAVNEALYILSPISSEKSFHAALPLYLISNNNATGHELYLLCWVLNHQCFVCFFRNGNCELANSYPVANESEVMYYCMANIKKAGADARKVHFELLGDNTDALLQLFQRFISNVRKARIELPYNAGEYPPHASVSYLMHYFLTCELPVEH